MKVAAGGEWWLKLKFRWHFENNIANVNYVFWPNNPIFQWIIERALTLKKSSLRVTSYKASPESVTKVTHISINTRTHTSSRGVEDAKRPRELHGVSLLHHPPKPEGPRILSRSVVYYIICKYKSHILFYTYKYIYLPSIYKVSQDDLNFFFYYFIEVCDTMTLLLYIFQF